MTAMAKVDVEHFRKLGVTFLPNFRRGATSVKARYDLPQLFYPASFDEHFVDAEVERFTRVLQAQYSGHCHYGHCPQLETEHLGGRVFVLFADDQFYDEFQGSDVACRA